ncbi:DNA polymerase III delta prime subunit [Filimonas zeae]|uniref:AAA+ ATPase domain-containing protein n=1 Tax=Filimonas zeae TaxID=1737353 RepID=A0A917IZS2_9BACT|nr:AAA family ATPase [Filimonas zeae]MDR6339830.1 DNA polymerase III delta prime subunit [Filimonas zeae]GGH69860.1 hypothetical protein GCM10011379_27580 [Filimonas zeae]
MERRTLENICKGINVWTDWQANYKKFVPEFIKEAASGSHWENWNQDVFHEFFIKSSDQCVSSLKQGYFTNKEKEAIKTHWDEIAPLLQKIAQEQYNPQYEVYNELKTQIREYTNFDRRAATNRLIAGLQPQLLCTIVNQHKLWELYALLTKHVAEPEIEWKPTWFENSYQMQQLFKKALQTDDGYQIITYPWQVYEEHDFTHSNKAPNNDMSEDKIAEISALLKYKKQIILQGPPGTGKTRLAKEIAQMLTDANSTSGLTKEIITANCQNQTSIPTAKTKLNFRILGVNGNGVRVENSEGKEYTAPYNDIVNMYEQKAWEKEGVIINGANSYSAAVAKFLYGKLNATTTSENTKDCKIIQFHPSYSYEDFVRGLVAKPDPDDKGIVYNAENKILAQIAEEAYQNFALNQSTSQPTAEVNISHFQLFIDDIKEQIAESKEQKLSLTDQVYLFEPDDKKFKYKGDNWIAHKNGLNMKYSELEKIIASGVKERSQIKNIPDLQELTKQHSSYFIRIVDMYYEYLKKHPLPSQTEVVETKLKNYVLIIDEINRANLSSVLGELIYGLEYRNKPVNSMYAIDGDKQLVLPPNFYIIGTMNTADRSVGHIDYAIRRRFAFVDVLPEALEEDEEIYFNTAGFTKVAALFNSNNVSPEFEAKDVQVGHSYFIVKKQDAPSIEERDELFRLKMTYEVVPILLEYVKDGILNGTVAQMDVKNYIISLKQ